MAFRLLLPEFGHNRSQAETHGLLDFFIITNNLGYSYHFQFCTIFLSLAVQINSLNSPFLHPFGQQMEA